jgi:hypothetical protein
MFAGFRKVHALSLAEIGAHSPCGSRCLPRQVQSNSDAAQ